jgi:DNA-binding transcriptional LysR family regulator
MTRLSNWRNLDLNLLVVFCAVMQERSVTGAAAKLNMSQPAVSHAIKRLRDAVGDELLVRTPVGLEPTPFALRIHPRLAESLDSIRTTVQGAKNFSPQTAERQFKIALNNYAALVLAAPLVTAVAREAPGIQLELRPSGTVEVTEALDTGEIDAVISQIASPGDRFSDVRLFEEGFAALVREGHPAVSAGAISLENFGALLHLVLSSTGEDTDFVADVLRGAGLTRKVAARVPLLAAGRILLDSDLITVMGRRAAHALAASGPLQVVELPFDTPVFPMAMMWHRRLDDSEAHKWLRQILVRVAKSVRN